jgi:hypothetical protein
MPIRRHHRELVSTRILAPSDQSSRMIGGTRIASKASKLSSRRKSEMMESFPFRIYLKGRNILNRSFLKGASLVLELHNKSLPRKIPTRLRHMNQTNA